MNDLQSKCFSGILKVWGQGQGKEARKVVKVVSGNINDELYEMVIAKGNEIGLKNVSEFMRYAFAIACGYSEKKARIIAKIKPQLPFSELQDEE
jgi:hypothetical protein